MPNTKKQAKKAPKRGAAPKKSKVRKSRGNNGDRMALVAVPSATAVSIGSSKPRIMDRSYSTMKIGHCEFITEVMTNSDYVAGLSGIIIGPNRQFMPWGSLFASQFQKYRFLKMDIIYVPSCGTSHDGNLDMVVSLDINTTAPPTLAGLLQFENRQSISLYQAGKLSVSPKELMTLPELWTSQSGAFNPSGATKLNWPGWLFISPTSSETSFLCGRIYVDYILEYFDPAPPLAVLSPVSTDFFYIEGGSVNFSAAELVWGDVGTVVTDLQQGLALEWTTENLANHQLTRAFVVNEPVNMQVQTVIDLEVTASIAAVGSYSWSYAWLIFDKLGNVVNAIADAAGHFTNGLSEVITGVEILATAFLGQGPWAVAPHITNANGYNTFTGVYDGAYVQVTRSPSAAQFNKLRSQEADYIAAGLQNGYCRLELAGGPGIDDGDIFGNPPTLVSEVIAVATWGSNVLELKNVNPGPYQMTLRLAGTGITGAANVTATGATLGTVTSVVNTAGTTNLLTVAVYVTGDPAFTFTETATTINTSHLYFSPAVAYVYV